MEPPARGLALSMPIPEEISYSSRSDSRMKKLAGALLSEGIEIGGPFPPLNNWARISIGLPKENALARSAIEKLLSGRTNQQASALATARWNVAANCLYPSTCP